MLLLSFYLVIIGSCKMNKPESNNLSIEKTAFVYPSTPKLDSLKKWCSINYADLTITPKSDLTKYDSFSFNNQPFSGWACQIFEDHAHRYRYTQFKDGKRLRLVAYYVNGVIDSDFYTDWSMGYGTERMWMADGKPYIESYFVAPGVMHGLQRRWFSNNKVAREALYNQGVLVYELEYNKEGNLINSKGTIPTKKSIK